MKVQYTVISKDGSIDKVKSAELNGRTDMSFEYHVAVNDILAFSDTDKIKVYGKEWDLLTGIVTIIAG